MIKEIYFAGGCFWGTQHYFKQICGVIETATGYANGKTENPVYEEVYTDMTGFAETVKVVYDSNRISLVLLVELFFKSIDPLSLNRQGNDVGTRYRTGIYYSDNEDLQTIKAVYEKVAAEYGSDLCVEFEPLLNFLYG